MGRLSLKAVAVEGLADDAIQKGFPREKPGKHAP